MATDARRQFNPHAFAASQETIYILSKEGAGSAAPLTAPLTVEFSEGDTGRNDTRIGCAAASGTGRIIRLRRPTGDDDVPFGRTPPEECRPLTRIPSPTHHR